MKIVLQDHSTGRLTRLLPHTHVKVTVASEGSPQALEQKSGVGQRDQPLKQDVQNDRRPRRDLDTVEERQGYRDAEHALRRGKTVARYQVESQLWCSGAGRTTRSY